MKESHTMKKPQEQVLAEARARKANDWIVPSATRRALTVRGELDVPMRSTEIPEDQAAHFARMVNGPRRI
jgi:hypothetical protein